MARQLTHRRFLVRLPLLMLLAASVVALAPTPALCDFTIYRLIEYGQHADFHQSREQNVPPDALLGVLSAMEILLESKHDAHFTGSHTVSVSDSGIHASIECSEAGSDKTVTFTAIVRFDKKEAWLIAPEVGRFTWIKFSDIRKSNEKQARNRGKDWGTGWVDNTKNSLRQFREPVVLVDSLIAGWPSGDDFDSADSTPSSHRHARRELRYAEDPEDDSLIVKAGCSATIGQFPLADTLRKYRERLESELLLRLDSGIIKQFPLDLHYDDLVTPLIPMYRSDSLGRQLVIDETTFDCHFLDRGGRDKLEGKRIYKERGSIHQSIRLVTVDYKDISSDKFKLPRHLKRIVQRDLDIERILAMILL